jgi:putative SOS response-associated peptidase YedK
MCGRFTRFSPIQKFADLFGTQAGFSLNPRYNIAPSQALLLGRNAVEGGRELVSLHWGLIPYWAKEPRIGYSTINARAETVAEKPTFRDAFRYRRCLIAADGYYEWRKLERTKQPYFIALKDGEPFAFGGLWEHWAQKDQSIDSCAIIVTEANPLTKAIHGRMPVILSPEDYDAWMDPDLQHTERLKAFLRPYPPERMCAYPVSTTVNDPKNDKPELITKARSISP